MESRSLLATDALDSIDQNGALKKRRVYQHQTPFCISELAWSNEPGGSFQLAVCSLINNARNCVEIVRLDKDDYNQELRSIASFDHHYPATKVLWMPRTQSYRSAPNIDRIAGSTSDTLLATSSDHLRLWRLSEKHAAPPVADSFLYSDNTLQKSNTEIEVGLECLLNQNPTSNKMKPLTSFDWNDVDPRLIVTASLDTTCTLWNVEYEKIVTTYEGTNSPNGTTKQHLMGKVRRRLVAHDDSAYGVSFSRFGSGRDVFVSVGGDQTVRSFDLRNPNRVVLYEGEAANRKAFIRVNCSKQNENLLSFFAVESSDILILDIRKPGQLLCSLTKHSDNVNCMSWAPHSATHLATGSDDNRALIWNLDTQRDSLGEPLLAYRASGRINAISWSSAQPDWIAISYANYLELLRV